MNSFAEMLGISTSGNKTCFLGTTDEGMAVLVNGRDYFLRYADFPWFEYCGATELRDVTSDRWGVYWNTLGIDLPIEALERPELFPEKIEFQPGMHDSHFCRMIIPSVVTTRETGYRIDVRGEQFFLKSLFVKPGADGPQVIGRIEVQMNLTVAEFVAGVRHFQKVISYFEVSNKIIRV